MRIETIAGGLVLVAVATVGAEEVYKTVDEAGNVVYTDQPSENAEKLTVEGVQTVSPPAAPDFSYEPPASPPVPAYTRAEIGSPAHDEAIRTEDEDVVKVSVRLEPALDSQDTVTLYLDGREVGRGKSTSFALPAVDRGTHQLSATVHGPNGEFRVQTPTSTFHLLKVSIQPKPAPTGKPK